jgi:hypothetical protein
MLNAAVSKKCKVSPKNEVVDAYQQNTKTVTHPSFGNVLMDTSGEQGLALSRAALGVLSVRLVSAKGFAVHTWNNCLGQSFRRLAPGG